MVRVARMCLFQVTSLSTKRLLAAHITGEQDDERVRKGVVNGFFQVIFFTPEILLNNKQWRQLLSTNVYLQQLRALVLDKAHTVKKWY